MHSLGSGIQFHCAGGSPRSGGQPLPVPWKVCNAACMLGCLNLHGCPIKQAESRPPNPSVECSYLLCLERYSPGIRVFKATWCIKRGLDFILHAFQGIGGGCDLGLGAVPRSGIWLTGKGQPHGLGYNCPLPLERSTVQPSYIYAYVTFEHMKMELQI